MWGLFCPMCCCCLQFLSVLHLSTRCASHPSLLLQAFTEAFVSGTAKPFFKSEPVPEPVSGLHAAASHSFNRIESLH